MSSMSSGLVAATAYARQGPFSLPLDTESESDSEPSNGLSAIRNAPPLEHRKQHSSCHSFCGPCGIVCSPAGPAAPAVVGRPAPEEGREGRKDAGLGGIGWREQLGNLWRLWLARGESNQRRPISAYAWCLRIMFRRQGQGRRLINLAPALADRTINNLCHGPYPETVFIIGQVSGLHHGIPRWACRRPPSHRPDHPGTALEVVDALLAGIRTWVEMHRSL